MADQALKPLQLDLWQALHELGPVPVDATNKPLFQRGQPPDGIYLVEEGEVRLLLSSLSNAREMAFEVAGAGSVLGLSEAVSGGTYKLTAEAKAGARVSYIARDELLNFLHRDHQRCLQIVRLLSEDLHSLYYRCRCLAPGGGRSAKNADLRVN